MKPASHSERDFGYLLLLLAWLFGAYVRFSPVAAAGFPVNDGGLFYRFVQEIQANHFALPAFSSYNQVGLPLTYPPLAFYLTAALQSLTHLPLIELIRWLPPLFSWLQIGVFFLLARELAQQDFLAGLATLMYALLPRVYEWDSMGGGLTRGLGNLLGLLLLGQIVKLLREPTKIRFAAVVVSGSGVLLTHPERSLHVCLAILLLWWFLGRTRPNFLRLLAAGVGVLLLTAPWWLTVLRLHGSAPYLASLKVTGSRALFWEPLVSMTFTDELIRIIVSLAAVGTAASLVSRRWFLPLWMVLAFLIDPRNAPTNTGVPLTLLAAQGWVDVILPGLARLANVEAGAAFNLSRHGRWLYGGLIILLFLSAGVQSLHLGSYHVSPLERAGMAWVSQNTPPTSRFVMFTWRDHPLLSPVVEWFPALTGRANLTTVQGREWLPGAAHFTPWLALSEEVQACLYQDAACLETKLQAQAYDYVWISLGDPPQQSALSVALEHAPGYARVFDNGQVQIYQRAAGQE